MAGLVGRYRGERGLLYLDDRLGTQPGPGRVQAVNLRDSSWRVNGVRR
jgi:hypothetical protein